MLAFRAFSIRRVILLLHILLFTLPAYADTNKNLYIPQVDAVTSEIVLPYAMISSAPEYTTILAKLNEHIRVKTSLFKGDFGEKVTHEFLTKTNPGWVPIDPKFGSGGRQGLDHLFIRYRTTATGERLPDRIMVVESKSYGAILRKGQMTETWIGKKLVNGIKNYQEMSNAIAKGDIIKSSSLPTSRPDEVASLELTNGQKVYLFKYKNGKWNVYSKKEFTYEELNKSLRTHSKLFESALQGKIGTNPRLSKIVVEGDEIKIFLSKLDSNAHITETQVIKVSDLNNPEIDRLIRKYLTEQYMEKVGVTKQQAEKMVARCSKEEVIERIGKGKSHIDYMKRKTTINRVVKGSLKMSAKSALFALAFDVLGQKLTSGEIDYSHAIKLASITGMSAGVGAAASYYTTMYFGNDVAGLFIGSGVTSLVSAYGMYAAGMIDINTANKMAVTSFGITAATWAITQAPLIGALAPVAVPVFFMVKALYDIDSSKRFDSAFNRALLGLKYEY